MLVQVYWRTTRHWEVRCAKEVRVRFGDALLVGLLRPQNVTPNVRAKRAPAAWHAGQQAQNGAKPQRLMASVPRRWYSA
jgi:hypothetical protein